MHPTGCLFHHRPINHFQFRTLAMQQVDHLTLHFRTVAA